MPGRGKIFRVAVALDRSSAGVAAFEGIVDAASMRRWRLGDATAVGEADGVIRDAGAVAPPHALTVTFSTGYAGTGDVRPDAALIDRMAREHFTDRGFSDFVKEPDYPAALPSPSACFFTSDDAAAAFVKSATAAGRSVPGDLAVLGVGNSSYVCHRCDPPLSSIDPGLYRLGRQAALRMDRLLLGRSVPDVDLVPPAGVVERASTDTLALADADVAAAVRFIRDHASGPLRIGDVLRALRLDRRTLERRFEKSLGRSPAEVMRRCRVGMAAKLLRSTDRPITNIAVACGFRLPQHLAAAFKRQTGQTPSDYRSSMQGNESFESLVDLTSRRETRDSFV